MAEEKKSMAAEFKEFIMRGNVMDMAVGVIIGGAFQKIISSLVDDIIMPLISAATGGIDFSNWFIQLDAGAQKYATLAEAQEAGVATLNYGVFITAVIDFLLVALAIFMMIKAINKLHKPAEEEPAAPARMCPYCKSEIAEDATRCPHCTSEL